MEFTFKLSLFQSRSNIFYQARAILKNTYRAKTGLQSWGRNLTGNSEGLVKGLYFHFYFGVLSRTMSYSVIEVKYIG